MNETAALRAALTLFAPIAPLLAAGVLRAATGLSLALSAVASLVLCAVGAVALRRWGGWALQCDRVTAGALACGALAAAGLIALLWNRELGLLVTVGGGDAGNHVSLQHEFVRERHDVYQSFVTFYAAVGILAAVFRLDDFGAFAAGFALVLLVVPLATAAAAASLGAAGAPLEKRSSAVFLALLVVALTAGVVRLWGPWFHYHQADGFYAHLFGLVPLFAGWLAVGVSSSPLVRVGVVLGFVVVHRFTYGLNLGDWMVVAAVTTALEARRVDGPRLRWALAALVAGLLGAAVVAYRALWPLHLVEGGVIPGDLYRLLWAQGLLVAALAGAVWLRWRSGLAATPLLTLPLTFGAVSFALHLAFVAAGLSHRYYFYKYGLHALVWMSAAVLAWVCAEAGRLADPGARHRAIGLGVAVLGAAAVVVTMSGTRVYWRGFVERAFRTAPYERIDALSDPGLLSHARAILAEQGARSGGVLESSWPRSNFMNASLDSFHAFNEGWARFAEGRVELAPGRCVFWLEGDSIQREYDELATQLPATKASWSALVSDSEGKTCVPHSRPWRREGPLRRCHRCAAR